MTWRSWLPIKFAQKVAYELIPVGVQGQPQYPSINFENNVKEGLAKNEIIYRCIMFKVRQLAQIDLVVVNAKGELLPNHKLKTLLTRPSPVYSQNELLAQIFIDLDLYGRAYVEKVKTRGGDSISQLWRLRPDRVYPVPTKEKYISHYEYKIDGTTVILPYDDVVEFKYFHPLDPYKGLAPISVASRIGDVDSGGVDYLAELFRCGGRPAGFIKSKKPISKSQVATIHEEWENRYGGAKNWIRPAVLGEDVDYQKIGLDVNEMALKDVDEKTISRICMVFGVNPILIGAAHGLSKSTYNNYQTARKSFWDDELQPQINWLVSVINNQLTQVDFQGVTIKEDLTNVAALQPDKKEIWARAGLALTQGYITVNESRKEAGLEPVQGGDVFLRGMNLAEAQASVISKKEQKSNCGCGIEHKAAVPPDNDDRIKREDETTEIVAKFFAKQQKRIMAQVVEKNDIIDYVRKTFNFPEFNKLAEADGKKYLSELTAHAFKEIDGNFWDNEDDEFYATLYPAMLASVQISIANEIAAFEAANSVAVPIDLANDLAIKWLREYGFNLVKDINQTSQQAISEAIIAWVDTALPRSALASELAPLFGDVRARAIGRTETTRAFFEGNRAVWKSSKMVRGWAWKTTETACLICGPLEYNLTKKIYSLNSASILPAHPNCNCFAIAILKGE